MTPIDTRLLDLARLNSATKYPSIPTYHALGDRGILLDERIDFGNCDLIYTEKVDGTNSRIVLLPDGYFLIGSREELLHARGDLVHNPAMGIVDALRDIAESLVPRFVTGENVLTAFYLETYGGRITGAAKNYTGEARVAYRLFDVSRVDASVLEMPTEEISRWREANGQSFIDETTLQEYSGASGLELTPRLTAATRLPESINDVSTWLSETIPSTQVALDAAAKGEPEGVVVRTADRSVIAKVRFEDYRRTLRRR